MKKKRLRINVDGDVQGVRYRVHIRDIVKSKVKGLSGYVENMDDGSVEIVCEGSKDKVDKFFKIIQGEKGKEIPKYHLAKISSVTKFEETPTGKYANFRIRYGTTQEELSDQVGASYNVLVGYAEYMKKLDTKYGEISVNMGAAAKAITMLSGTITRLDNHLREDRKVIKSLVNDVNKLVEAVIQKQNKG